MEKRIPGAFVLTSESTSIDPAQIIQVTNCHCSSSIPMRVSCRARFQHAIIDFALKPHLALMGEFDGVAKQVVRVSSTRRRSLMISADRDVILDSIIPD